MCAQFAPMLAKKHAGPTARAGAMAATRFEAGALLGISNHQVLQRAQVQQPGRCGVLTGLNTGRILASIGAGESLSPLSKQIRVHTNATAQRLAELIGARAFTVGTHIGFARGAYQPDSTAGRELLHHELEHVAGHSSRFGVVLAWLTGINKGANRTYQFRGSEYAIEDDRNHEDLTREAFGILEKSTRYSKRAQEIVMAGSAEPDRWKDLRLLDLMKTFPELKALGTKIQGTKVEAEATLHDYDPTTSGKRAGIVRKGSAQTPYSLSRGGAAPLLLKGAQQRFEKDDFQGSLMLLGMSLHMILDFFSHAAPLPEREEARRVSERSRMLAEDDPRWGKWRWTNAVKASKAQLERFYGGLSPKKKAELSGSAEAAK